VLTALREHLMEPALFAEFCEEFTREINRIRTAGSATLESAHAEIRRIDRDLDRLVDMILRGGAAERLNDRMVQMEARKRELEAAVAEAKEPAPLLHPEMAGYYRRQVESLHEVLNSGLEAERLKATDLLRSLISAIVLTPTDEGLELDVQGDLAGILTLALNAKSPAVLRAGRSQVSLVAGTRFHLNLQALQCLSLATTPTCRSHFHTLFEAIA